MEDKQPVVIQGTAIHRERRTRPDAYRPDRSHRIRRSVIQDNGLQPRRRTVSHVRRREAEDTVRMASMIRKIAISALIVVLVLLLNSIDLPFTRGIIEQVRTALTDDFQIDETLGKLKFVADYIPDVAEVFAPNQEDNDEQLTFRAPAAGEVIRRFRETVTTGQSEAGFKNNGIDIKTTAGSVFYASADGQIAAVENHDVYGLSVWISHGSGMFSFYGGCTGLEVKKGQNVKQGKSLGKVKESGQGQYILHFEIWKDDQPVDPLSLIGTSNAIAREGV